MTQHHRFPCLDEHSYRGCVGLQACTAGRCWNGRRVGTGEGPVCADAFDRPLKIVRYTASDCPNCRHAVDLQVDGELRSAAGRRIEKWTVCELGLWAGPASLYNLLNHRAPVKRVGHCPHFVETPADQMRLELVQIRQADQERARRRRERLRAQREEAVSAAP